MKRSLSLMFLSLYLLTGNALAIGPCQDDSFVSDKALLQIKAYFTTEEIDLIKRGAIKASPPNVEAFFYEHFKSRCTLNKSANADNTTPAKIHLFGERHNDVKNLKWRGRVLSHFIKDAISFLCCLHW
ncbi:MAG: hypothetical protein HQK50_14950 [Oligoflexia bacterium]|nr:hypothetical protein [Oligoflexia bacterium]